MNPLGSGLIKSAFELIYVMSTVRVFFWSFFDSYQKNIIYSSKLYVKLASEKLKLPIQNDKIVRSCSQSLNNFLLLTLSKKAKKEAKPETTWSRVPDEDQPDKATEVSQ